MKTSYKKLIIYAIFLLLILIINSFLKNFLTSYKLVILIIISLLLFNKIFILEKARQRYIKDILIQLTIYLLIFFIAYYLFGILIGFYRVDDYFNYNGIFNFILPNILLIISKEFFRFQVFNKFDDNLLLYILWLTVFILIDTTNAIYYASFKTTESIFLLFALTTLPSISSNIFLSFLTKKATYIPCIYYLLIMRIYQYIIPIVPNPSKYLLSIINFLFPIILLFNMKKFFKDDSEEVMSRESNLSRNIALIVTLVVVSVLIYFNSGYFPHVAIAVASNSMYPFIRKGDVVIVKKVKDEQSLIPSTIIAYEYSNVIIVHRIEKRKIVDNNYLYYTKGDANTSSDDWVINNNMILGKVVYKIPYIGLPTLWLRDI